MYQIVDGEYLVTAEEIKWSHSEELAYIDFFGFGVVAGEIVNVAHTLIRYRVLVNVGGRTYLERIDA